MAELAQIFTTICLPVLAAMGLGWLLDRKFGLDLNTLVKINIYLLVPCFIFTRVASSQLGSAEAGKIILFTAAVIACMFLLSSAASMARRHPAGSRASLRLATMFYNSGNFGLPVVTLAFGEFGAAIQDRDIANRGASKDPVSDEEILQILVKMVKQREESARAFEEGNRIDLAEQERAEIAIIKGFLPKQLGEEDVRRLCAQVVSEVGADGLRDMSRCMNALKERYPGKMDFGKASGIVKGLLQ